MYVSNVPISRPIPLANVDADLDFNGVQWNNVIGLFYVVDNSGFSPIKAPTLFPPGPIPAKYGG